MNVFQRYLIYLVDCLAMLFVIGMQLLIFRGEFPIGLPFESWLPRLLDGHSTGITMLMGGTLFWTIVDYHEDLEKIRRSRIISTETGTKPEMCTRVKRSFIKAFTLFTFPVLLLVALFRSDHRFLHDHLAKTERVKLPVD